MKEQLFLDTIKKIIGNKYIGDDCAYLRELGIVVSQDSLIEDVHFKTCYTSAYQLGYKSIMVNLSDICASGAVPKYVSIALSLPPTTDEKFISEFYRGAKQALGKTEIIGGDLTGADKIMVSVCAIGATKGCRISSRANAQAEQLVVTTGTHGSSAGGLELLLKGKHNPPALINAHLMPVAQLDAALKVSKNIQENYAMMDTSDGIGDALFKIAAASKKTLVIDFDKIKYENELKKVFSDDYKDKILFGGEDYQLVATVPASLLPRLNNWYVIGKVTSGEPMVQFKDLGWEMNSLEKCYNHFV